MTSGTIWLVTGIQGLCSRAPCPVCLVCRHLPPDWAQGRHFSFQLELESVAPLSALDWRILDIQGSWRQERWYLPGALLSVYSWSVCPALEQGSPRVGQGRTPGGPREGVSQFWITPRAFSVALVSTF